MAKSAHDLFNEIPDMVSEPKNATASTEDAAVNTSAHDLFNSIPEDKETEADSAMEVFGKQVLDVPTFGFGGEIAGALHNPAQAATAIGNLFRDEKNQQDAKDYYDYVKQYEQEFEQGKEKHPLANAAGFVTGLVPSLLTGGAVTKGATGALSLGSKLVPEAVAISRAGKMLAPVAKMATTGAALGAVTGAGEAENGEVLDQMKKNAAVGAVLGPVLEGLLPAAVKGGHESLKKYNPTYSRMSEAASGVYNRGIDYLDENLRRKVLSEEGQKAADALVNTTKTIKKQLDTEKQLAEPIDVDSLISPIAEGVEKLKTIKPDTSKLEESLINTRQNIAANISKVEGRLSQVTKDLIEKKQQLEALRQAKKEFTDKAMFSIDDEVSRKAAASMEQAAKTEKALTSDIAKLEQEAITLPQIKNQVASEGGQSISNISSQIENMPNLPSSTYASDVGKLENFSDELSRNIFVTPQGQLPSSKIPAQEAVIRNMLTSGEAPLSTQQGKSIATEVLNNIKSHYDKYGQTAELRDMMNKGLSAADMLEGVESNPAMLDDTARETIKFTQALVKASEQTKGSFQARELFDNAQKLLTEVKDKAAKLNRTDIVNSVDDFLNKSELTKQSAADWDLSRFLTNPNIPFTKSFPVRASAAGASIAKGVSKIASAPVSLTSSFLKTVSGQAHLDRLLSDPAIKQRSPSLYKYLGQLKDTQDEGKRKAIINIIQNNDIYNRLTKVESGEEDGEQTK